MVRLCVSINGGGGGGARRRGTRPVSRSRWYLLSPFNRQSVVTPGLWSNIATTTKQEGTLEYEAILHLDVGKGRRGRAAGLLHFEWLSAGQWASHRGFVGEPLDDGWGLDATKDSLVFG